MSSTSWDPSYIDTHEHKAASSLLPPFLGLRSQGPWSSDIRGDMTHWLWGPIIKSASLCVMPWPHTLSRTRCSASLLWVNLYLVLPGTGEVEKMMEPRVAPLGPMLLYHCALYLVLWLFSASLPQDCWESWMSYKSLHWKVTGLEHH